MSITIRKVYTRTGDGGDTGIIGGARVPKDSLRIASYGATDELCSVMGLARVFNREQTHAPEFTADVERILLQMQEDIFDAGNELATPPDKMSDAMPRITEDRIAALEKIIDEWSAELEPLKSFLLSGGGRVSGMLHLARTVCRRAERIAVAFSREEDISPLVIQYLNRLSDALFVLARVCAKRYGEEEFLWQGGLKARTAKS